MTPSQHSHFPKRRSGNIVNHKVWGSLFGTFGGKWSPRPFVLPGFWDAVFHFWKWWNSVTPSQHFHFPKRRSENIVKHNVWGSLFCTFGPKKLDPFTKQMKILCHFHFSKCWRIAGTKSRFQLLKFASQKRLDSLLKWMLFGHFPFPGNDSHLFYHADFIGISWSVIFTWCNGISMVFNFRKRENFSGKLTSDRDFFRQIPRWPSTTFDFSAPGRPPAGQSLLPPTP